MKKNNFVEWLKENWPIIAILLMIFLLIYLITQF